MFQRKKSHQHIVLLVTFFVVVFLLTNVVFALSVYKERRTRSQHTNFGVTFSKGQAEYLGLHWQSTFLALLDELQVRHFRLPVYWDEVEPREGVYSFANIDFLLDQAKQRDAQVILAIGRRTPRWPECHTPSWAKVLSSEAQQEQVLELLRTLVERYRRYDNIIIWQVENEPLLDVFGDCPPSDASFLQQEIMLVKSLDSRPVMVTDSGELSLWVRTAPLADILGTSLYRIVHNPYLGNLFYPITPAYYQRKAAFSRIFVDKVIVTELQAEPWGVKPIMELSIPEQLETMNAKILSDNVSFARRVGFEQVYLWGAEWWYYLKQHGDDSLWQEAKKVFKDESVAPLVQ